MEKTVITFEGEAVAVYTLNTVVVGTGATGFNAADTLYSLGQTDVCIVTNGINRGTSRNTGSDKQTYYKLSLAGNCPDSVGAMARDLFAGGCVDGDVALCEAALSVRCFYKLCSIGVDFPTNRYGEYVGYQTDHDTAGRATSVGPLTSMHMTQQLEQQVKAKAIPILDRHQVVAVLSHNGRARGLLCYCESAVDRPRYAVFNCQNIVFATGGPAGIYQMSVYPESQTGATGLALEAGVIGRNLTEWQFGLASLQPRWNVSGTYMQVLPRFVSVDDQGVEHEFVTDYYGDSARALSMIFKKGYQWPFDVRKIDGSSLIDLLVYRENILLGRKVYLDFTRNPLDREPVWDNLEPEATRYLQAAGACFGTPVERLLHMNAPAYELYLNKGVDLKKDRLEVAVCAQHHNGGLDVDVWWQSNLKGFFPCGEAAGSHGVFRPGGSALNAGQVGSTRSAQYIAARCQGAPSPATQLLQDCGDQIRAKWRMAEATRSNTANTKEWIDRVRADMTRVGGAVRNPQAMQTVAQNIDHMLTDFGKEVKTNDSVSLGEAYRLYDMLLTQRACLTAMLHFAQHGNSRGSALYSRPDGQLPPGLPALFACLQDGDAHAGVIQETRYDPATGFQCAFRPVRPLPEGGGFFETVWRSYRENKNID